MTAKQNALTKAINELRRMERAAREAGASRRANRLYEIIQNVERGMIAYEVALEDALNTSFTADGVIEDWED